MRTRDRTQRAQLFWCCIREQAMCSAHTLQQQHSSFQWTYLCRGTSLCLFDRALATYERREWNTCSAVLGGESHARCAGTFMFGDMFCSVVCCLYVRVACGGRGARRMAGRIYICRSLEDVVSCSLWVRGRRGIRDGGGVRLGWERLRCLRAAVECSCAHARQG